MRKITPKLLISITLMTLLSACDDGHDSSSYNIKQVGVTGEFKSAIETGIYFNSSRAPQNYGINGGHCANYANTYYYETENTLIFGDESLPDSDFEQAAQWVESGLIEATAQMDTTKGAYFSLRDNYSPSLVSEMFKDILNTLKKERALPAKYYVFAEQLELSTSIQTYNYIAENLLNLVTGVNGDIGSSYPELLDFLSDDYLALSEDDKLQALITAINELAQNELINPVTSPALTLIELPNDSDLWELSKLYKNDDERNDFPVESYLYEKFKALTSEQKGDVVEYYLDWVNQYHIDFPISLTDAIYQQKLYVCLTNGTSSSSWGEGTKLGLSFSAPSVYSKSKSQQTIVHELIHTVQLAYTSSPHNFSFLPRWILEGQAVYLSGQEIANKSSHANYEPVSISHYNDEYGDVGEAYKHYGLAYSYIHENNNFSNIKRTYEALNDIYSEKSITDAFGASNVFKTEFNNNIKDHNGDALSYDLFKQNYDDYMSNWKN